MRGFTMILVVLNHVAGLCLNIDGSIPSLNTYFYEFRMPLFFFVSGFVLYRRGLTWNMAHTLSFLKKKFPIQIISTCIFFLAFVYTSHGNLIESLWSDSKSGYWFTFVLFEYFILYSLIRLIALFLKLDGKKEDAVVLVTGLLVFAVSVPSVMSKLPVDNEVLGLISLKHWCYFVFFCIGTMVKKYFEEFQRLLDGRLLLSVCLILFFGLNIFRDVVIAYQYNLFRLLTGITGIVIVFGFFRSGSAVFCNQTKMGRMLCYIGRRTLDIYFLHYFLLPLNLSAVVQVFNHHPMPVLEFFTSLIISLLIIATCLVISNVLRLSSVLARILFGVK